MLSAAALFPRAPEYVMLSTGLGAGSASCYASAPCRTQATAAVNQFMRRWEQLNGLAWTETREMSRLFGPAASLAGAHRLQPNETGQAERLELGALPMLLFSLAALGHQLERVAIEAQVLPASIYR